MKLTLAGHNTSAALATSEGEDCELEVQAVKAALTAVQEEL